MVQLEQYYRRIEDSGVEVYAVSVDPPETSKRLKEKLDVSISFLSDPGGSLLDELGIRHVGAREGRDIAYPTSVLVDGAGTVRWIYASGKVNRRANPAEVLAAIGTLPD